jgi:hypothetical protein
LSGVATLLVEVSDDGSNWVTTAIAISLREEADFDSGEATIIIGGVTIIP